MSAECRHVVAVNVPEACGKKAIQRLAKRCLGRAAEHRFGGRVEQHDALLGVERHDGVHRRTDDGPQQRSLKRILLRE